MFLLDVCGVVSLIIIGRKLWKLAFLIVCVSVVLAAVTLTLWLYAYRLDAAITIPYTAVFAPCWIGFAASVLLPAALSSQMPTFFHTASAVLDFDGVVTS